MTDRPIQDAWRDLDLNPTHWAMEALTILNEKRIPFILSYDGSCGERQYGDPLSSTVAHRILLDVGRSSQATLNGRDDVTMESLYVSHFIPDLNN